MHSHVLPIPPCTCTAVSHTVRAARAQYALATRPAAARVGGREVVDGPRRVQRDAVRTLHQAARLGEQVLHGLERTDGYAVLLALRRVRDGDVEHTAHHADEIGTRERQTERRPLGEVVAGEEPTLVGDHLRRRARRDHTNRARQVGAHAHGGRVEAHAGQPIAGTFGHEHVRVADVVVGVDRVERSGRRAGRHDRGLDERRRERDHRATGLAHARPAGEIAARAPAPRTRRRRPRRRARRRRSRLRRHSRAVRSRRPASSPRELEPPGVAHRGAEALAPRWRRRGRRPSRAPARARADGPIAAARPAPACRGCPRVRPTGSTRPRCRERRRAGCSRPSGRPAPAARRPGRGVAARLRAPDGGRTRRSARRSR